MVRLSSPWKSTRPQADRSAEVFNRKKEKRGFWIQSARLLGEGEECERGRSPSRAFPRWPSTRKGQVVNYQGTIFVRRGPRGEHWAFYCFLLGTGVKQGNLGLTNKSRLTFSWGSRREMEVSRSRVQPFSPFITGVGENLANSQDVAKK